MPANCWECGEDGHLRAYCPLVSCNQCGHQGHLARVCSAMSRSSKPRRQNKNGNKWAADKYTCTANPHRLPWNWNVSNIYGESFEDAIAGLEAEGRQFNMHDVEEDEFEAIEGLVHKTWESGKVGFGVDGANLNHSSIEVVNIQRIENPGLYEKYSLVKQEMLQVPKSERAYTYTPVEQIPGGTRPIWTTKALKRGSFLRENFFTAINEHYMFHGTKEDNVMSIAENGFNTDLCLDRGLMGAGIYFAESSTKADMYADFRHRRTQGPKHMFLVRVLLGSSYVNTVQAKIPLEHPPCSYCRQHSCSCGREDYFDSVIDDSGRPFRVFAVYESDLCYPEYLITYQRLYDDEVYNGGDSYHDEYEEAEAFFSNVQRSSLSNERTSYYLLTGSATKQTTTVTNVTSVSVPRSQPERLPSQPQPASPALTSSPVTRGLDRALNSSSSSSPLYSEVCGWAPRPPATAVGSQWSNGLPSRPQSSFSSERSSVPRSQPELLSRQPQPAMPALTLSPVTRGLDRALNSSSPSSPLYAGVSGWVVGPPATAVGSQWSNGLPSRPQSSFSSARSSDQSSSSSSSRGILGRIWDFLFG